MFNASTFQPEEVFMVSPKPGTAESFVSDLAHCNLDDRAVLCALQERARSFLNSSDGPDRDLLRASDLASLLQVDLKTIHNWFEKGQLEGFRTPGRHLRFRRPAVATFMKKYGYPIPAWLEKASAVTAANPSPGREAAT